MATILTQATKILYRKLLLNLEQVAGESGVTGLGIRFVHSTGWRCSPTAVQNGRRLNVGVMGAGRIATTVHLGNIINHRRLNLKWITEDNPERVQIVKDLFDLDDKLFLTSRVLPDLLSSKDLDAVFVFTPTDSHYSIVCESLSKGKSVFVEKPTGENMKEIRSCYEHSEKFGKPLLTAFQRRFDPAFQKVVSAAHSKSIGDIQMLNFRSRDSPKPSYDFLGAVGTSSTGCGILTDLAVHDIDLMVWITRAQRPESVYVVTHTHDTKMAEFGEADTMVAVVKYKCGILATLDASRYAAYGYDMRLEVFGSDGLATVENPKVSSEVIDMGRGARMTRLNESFTQRFRESYINEIDHFIDCVDGKAKPLITKEESVMTAEIIEKGLESFRLKRPVYF
ncbi:myo-inositol 2-dehydrogenase-like [Gigantopelta aegis]|uniref:myo-inositol 2-dehydrogenase-like n=1 Tax=Gigantopelta aegis TaxID=1735272 RepID=UPI001B88DC51|nr:myo-inositol 2-dehydrogenase-like [Gigantopelta aegis]